VNYWQERKFVDEEVATRNLKTGTQIKDGKRTIYIVASDTHYVRLRHTSATSIIDALF